MIRLWGQRMKTEPTGLGSLICSYHIDSMLEFFAGTFDPPDDEDMSFLSENFGERVAEQWWDGGYIANITFEGLVNPNIHQWGLHPAFKEAKLPTHPNFQAILKKYNGSYDATTGVIIWRAALNAPTSNGLPGSTAAQSNPNPLFGQDSYVEVAAIYRSQRIVTEPPDDVLTRLGKIMDKLPDDVKDYTPAGRNWIIMPSPCTKRGEVFEDTQEWLLSPPGRPWNADVQDFILGLG